MRCRWSLVLAVVLVPALLSPGCATLGEFAALRLVDFHLDRASDGRLAGLDLARYRRSEDLDAEALLRLAAALRRGNVPLEMTLHVGATNPASNRSAARLTRLDWTLLIDDRETVGGILDREFRIEPGGTTDIPLPVRLDLAQFFRRDAKELLDVALDAFGRGSGTPRRVRLVATPTVVTSLGPMRYPGRITIASRSSGGAP